MTNEIIKKDDLRGLTTKQLWAQFKDAMSITASGMRKMAGIWVELERRGEDLSSYRNPMLSFLPDVASGRMLPEVLIRYGSSVAVLAAIAGLVPEDQKKLAAPDARVTVLAIDGTTRRARITDLRQVELRQVLGDGKIRTLAEQQRHLAPAPRTFGTRTGSAAPINSDWDLYAMLTVDQRKRLTMLSDQAGMSPSEFAVDALVRHKIIPGKPAKRYAPESITSASLAA